ncbi:MAG: hypothetical protein RBQ97_05885, partial [Acholeplasma sp.]|nr:hypothetical protein [Acholeplasma sp.]
MFKKILIVLLFLGSFLLVSCDKRDDDNQKNASDYLNRIIISYQNDENETLVTEDISLKMMIDDYYVAWKSDNSAITIIDSRGIVNRSNVDTEVTLTATITIDEKPHTKDFSLLVGKVDAVLPQTFKITWDYNYEVNNKITVIDVIENKTITEIKPTQPGYTFKYWEYNNEEYVFDQPVTKSFKLVAKWQKNDLNVETYLEDFEFIQAMKDSGNNSSEYIDYEPYTDRSGFSFELIKARIDLGIKEGENAVTFAGRGDGEGIGVGGIYYSAINGGISYLEFDARLPFSPNSKYPQSSGKDKASNVHVYVKINNETVLDYQFSDDKIAAKGTKVTIDTIDIKEDFSLSIEVSSGHRLTIDNLLWKSNPGVASEGSDTLKIDFEDIYVEEYDLNETVREINNISFVLKEVRLNSSNIHGEKERPYMTADNGQCIARFRGESTNPLSTEGAYMFNENPFESISKVTFSARKFGSYGQGVPYFGEGKIKVYYQTTEDDDWILMNVDIELGENFL